MALFGIGDTVLSRATAASAAVSETTGLRTVRAAEPSTVFVELGEAAQKANIARNGVAIPPLALDTGVLAGFLAGKDRVVAKVVSQSVAPGTTVARGTPIDVVLAEPGRLPVGIIRDVHVGLADRTMGEVFDTFVRNNAAVRGVLARNEQAATLSDGDRAVIASAMSAANVPVSQEPGRDVGAAFKALQGAHTFGLA